MALSEITEPSVRRAIAEFQKLGRVPFLAKYGFGPSKGYFIEVDGANYDFKAIAGVAHGFLNGRRPLQSSEFSGGDKTVATILRNLGFKVVGPENLVFENCPFEIGMSYNRQVDIHQKFGGQERGGIATPEGVPFVFLFTGESGSEYGYTDGWREDGFYGYTGEGQVGDMQFVRGN